MSKILTTLIAGLFAVSAFAADAPKTTTTTDAKANVEAPAATKSVKKAHKHHVAKKSSASGTTSSTVAPASK